MFGILGLDGLERSQADWKLEKNKLSSEIHLINRRVRQFSFFLYFQILNALMKKNYRGTV